MRQLHLANIANIAYGYAKILRDAGFATDVLCYDLTHILSLPEWVEGDFEIPVGDEWRPPLDHPTFERVAVPDWYRRIRSQDYWISEPEADRSILLSPQWADAIVRASEHYGSRWSLTRKDVLAYRPLVDALQARFFTGYDVIFGYAYGAIPPLLASSTPYVAVEIGTLRDTVSIDSPLGRLLALAYRTAPFTIVTNADCRAAAEALEIENYAYVPHPVDEDIFQPLAHDERHAIRRSLCESRYLLVAPARQSWDVKANDRYLRAFAELVRGGADATLFISEWGPDIGRAKQLIARLGIGERVKWFAPVPERRLARMFAAADLVLDQFGTFGTFGLIGPKAMACATPCLLSFDPALHAWCFDETPPVVGVREERDILQAMQHYLDDEPARTARGAQSRQWMLDHHSKAVVAEKMAKIVEQVTRDSRPATGFDALRQQKLALCQARQAPTSSALATRLRHVRARLGQTINGLRALQADRLRLAHLEDDTRTKIGAIESRIGAIESRIGAIESQSNQYQQGLLGAFDLMGKNRLEDRQVATKIRAELLEALIRSRLADPLRADAGARSRPPARDALSIEAAFRKLSDLAPLNWTLYLSCLDRGTRSYKGFPPGSCSTRAHPQAELFRAFLRPYIRGQVLDIGCGPQPVPWYLSDCPIERLSGIDPISKADDHPFFFVPGVGEFLPWEDSQFDAVVSATSLDHYYLLDRALQSTFRVLRPGGHFVAWIAEFAGAPPYDPYSTRMVRPYDDEHLFHIDRAWFLPLMAQTGFREVEILHLELPFHQLFMSFEKPAHGM